MSKCSPNVPSILSNQGEGCTGWKEFHWQAQHKQWSTCKVSTGRDQGELEDNYASTDCHTPKEYVCHANYELQSKNSTSRSDSQESLVKEQQSHQYPEPTIEFYANQRQAIQSLISDNNTRICAYTKASKGDINMFQRQMFGRAVRNLTECNKSMTDLWPEDDPSDESGDIQRA